MFPLILISPLLNILLVRNGVLTSSTKVKPEVRYITFTRGWKLPVDPILHHQQTLDSVGSGCHVNY